MHPFDVIIVISIACCVGFVPAIYVKSDAVLAIGYFVGSTAGAFAGSHMAFWWLPGSGKPGILMSPRRRRESDARGACGLMFALLRHPVYRLLFSAQIISLAGTGLTTVALGLLAFRLAGADAGAVLGTALAIKMVAYVGVSPLARAFLEDVSSRRVLIGLDLVRTFLVLCLLFVTEIWQIYVLIFLLQSASAAFTPTFQAVIPEILPDEKDYTNALSMGFGSFSSVLSVQTEIASQEIPVFNRSITKTLARASETVVCQEIGKANG